MRDEFTQVMDRIPSEPLKVYVYLYNRSTVDTRVGMTQQEISRATRLSVGAVRESLGWLEEPTYRDAALKTVEPIVPFVLIYPRGKAHIIELVPPYVAENMEIRFTFEDTDSRRIGVLEKEVRRLASKRGSNKLTLYFKGERQALIAEIEGDLGRGLTHQETWMLSGLVHQFSVERIRKEWRTKAHQYDLDKPLVRMYAMFMNKAHGHNAPQNSEIKEVDYPTARRNDEPV